MCPSLDTSLACMGSLTVLPLDESHLPAAGELLALRHRSHRAVEPLLDARFESVHEAELQVRAALAADGASGAIAFRDAAAVAFLVGGPKPSATWGPNIWVEAGSHAASDVEALRDTYALAAQRWCDEGLTSHFAVVPASDTELVDSWFRLGFGQQHAHAIQEPRRPTRVDAAGVEIRRAVRGDIPDLAALDLVLPRHQGRSPVFSSGTVSSLAETVAEWEEDFDDDRFAHFVATSNDTVVGVATGCALELSSLHCSLAVPPHAGFLGYAALYEDARGRGVGHDLGAAVMEWSVEGGFTSVVTDWRVTNLLSSRAWPRLGFRTTFLRLYRNVGQSG